VEETKAGFKHSSGEKTYRYSLKQTLPRKGDFIVRRRYILEEVTSGKRKSKGKKRGT